MNRESAILDFNRRVLAQARRVDVPLLERLRYITIVSSNLDEFFEVRFADYLEAARSPHTTVSRADVRAVSDAAHALIDEQYRVFNDELMPALQRRGLVILNHAERDAGQRKWVARFFEQQVRPLLVPVGLDPSHPFPQVANKSLNFICRLAGACRRSFTSSHNAAMRRDCSVRSVSRARSRAPFKRRPTVTFSAMDMVGNGFDFWNTMPTRRRTTTGSTLRA